MSDQEYISKEELNSAVEAIELEENFFKEIAGENFELIHLPDENGNVPSPKTINSKAEKIRAEGGEVIYNICLGDENVLVNPNDLSKIGFLPKEETH